MPCSVSPNLNFDLEYENIIWKVNTGNRLLDKFEKDPLHYFSGGGVFMQSLSSIFGIFSGAVQFDALILVLW